MENITVESWEEFDKELKSLLQERETWKNEGPLYVSEFLYRGQPNSDWHLKTTLERIIHKEISLLDYYRIVHFSKHRVETFTEKSWDIPSIEEYKELLEENKDELFWDTFQAYDYIAYLRHLGFPSPLLDWTSSPYVAAFFAFDKVSDKVSHVSLYVLLEYAGKGKHASTWEPYIACLGEYVRSHKRHFLQQSNYTICTALKDDGKRYYTNHENMPDNDIVSQNQLWKFNIPIKERIKVLKMLDKFNINSFSLFGSEESLVDTIATREFLVKGN